MKMTSTPFSVGLSDDTRVSSRVLRPPGGGHTDIFGSEPEPLRVGRRPGPNATVPAPPKVEVVAEPAAASAPSQNGSCAPPDTPAVTPTEPPAPAARPAPAAPPAAAEPAKGDAPRPAPANPEPPRRVRVPPGGFSSGLW